MLELKRIVNAVSRWLDVKMGVLPGWGLVIAAQGMLVALAWGFALSLLFCPPCMQTIIEVFRLTPP